MRVALVNDKRKLTGLDQVTPRLHLPNERGVRFACPPDALHVEIPSQQGCGQPQLAVLEGGELLNVRLDVQADRRPAQAVRSRPSLEFRETACGSLLAFG